MNIAVNFPIFRLLPSNCLNWKIYCDDHSSLWSTTAVQIYELFHIYLTSFHSSREIRTQETDLAPKLVHIAPASQRSRVRILLKPWFFQAFPFQLLKLKNLLRWSFFTFIYNHSSNIYYLIYTSHHKINVFLLYYCPPVKRRVSHPVNKSSCNGIMQSTSFLEMNDQAKRPTEWMDEPKVK